ncbi:MAG: glycosyl hydrolase family 28-related protein [Planctomycetota bacterium]
MLAESSRVALWALLLAAPLAAAGAAAPRYSKLWGREGERWTPESRLPDFSYAGYHRGEKPLPTLQPQVSVRDFGAVGDGKADDTAAFQRAIAEAKGKVIAVPPGRYVITDFLDIRHPGTCLKGAGPDKSVLYFPTPLNEIKPNWGATTSGRRTSNYSWSGGFLRVRGSRSRKLLAQVAEPAKRGAMALTVSAVERLKVGQGVRLDLRDTREQTLARHLYAGDPGSIKNLRDRARESFLCRVTKIDQDRLRIQFDRPLRTDVRLEWTPRLYPAASSVEEVGIEGLRFEFPDTPYRGHFTEVGYNAMALSGCRHCWVRDVRVTNADSGMFLRGANITLRGIVLESRRRAERSRNATGHHGVTLSGQDNLLEGFEFRTRFMHDITVTSRSAGNVAARGKGIDLCFDHHRYACHANLFTHIDLGEGTRMFQSGGGGALGRHSGAWETFWCIRARRGQSWPRGWGPDLMNLVGVQTSRPSVTDREGRWFEAIPPEALRPRNLYEAQLERRLDR